MKGGNNIISTLSESSMEATHFEAAVISILCYMAIRLMAKLYKRWRELHIWDILSGMYEGFAKFMAIDVECHVRPPADDTDDESDEPSYQTGNTGERIITISRPAKNIFLPPSQIMIKNSSQFFRTLLHQKLVSHWKRPTSNRRLIIFLLKFLKTFLLKKISPPPQF